MANILWYTCVIKSTRAHELHAMDALFDNISLDTLNPSEKASDKLTSMVNSILTGAITVTREDVLGFCKMLLLGDEMSATGHKSLGFIAKVMTKEHHPTWNVVVTVVKVTENLQEVLKYHTKVFELLTDIKNHLFILPACCKIMISDPRKYTQAKLAALLNKSNEFTYRKRSTENEKLPSPKRVKTTAEEMPSPSYQPVDGDALEGASLLIHIKTSPPRLQRHATRSPTSREIYTGSSILSAVSDVPPMTHKGISNAARALAIFFNSNE